MLQTDSEDWDSLQRWLRQQKQPALLVLDNAEELVVSAASTPGVKAVAVARVRVAIALQNMALMHTRVLCGSALTRINACN